MPLNTAWSTEIPLVGAGGEPVDLQRTLLSHGFVELPPMRLDEDVPTLELTLAVNGKARTVEIGPGRRHAFPTAEAMADADERFYKEVVRSGYRGPYFRAIAADVAAGRLDLELLLDPELPDDEVEARLLALPGVGPYATAQILMLLGRYSRLILDSWSRPKYAQLSGRKASDKTIERRFRRYKQYAGLAFWLYVTRDWVAEPAGIK